MVANILSVCGLYLGAERDLMPPSPDNARGYFENLRFVNLNKQILVATGGDWDLPPRIEPHEWNELPAIGKLKRRAARLVAGFAAREPWGWKDPRNSFTLPFWQSLIPDLKIVVCLRHPLEVHESLRNRRHTPHPLGIMLWRLHNQFILDNTQPAARLVTRYERYFDQPRVAEAECQRLLRFLSIDATESMLSACRNVTSESLRHYRRAHEDAGEAARLPPEVAELYARLCTEAEDF